MNSTMPLRHVPGFPAADAGRHEGAAASAVRETGARPLLMAEKLSIGWKKGRQARVLCSEIDLRLLPGRLVGLIGPNGSGKSTLLRTIAGLQPALGGAISIGGDPIGQLDAEERSRRVAVVFSDRIEAGYFSVFDIVAFGRYPYTDSRNRLRPRDVETVIGALESVGMEEFADRRFSSLSDGERQKVSVARAIAQDTEILILDEPTAFLDAPSRIEIFHLVARLAHESGKAVVICSHEVELALRSTDEVWIMDRNHAFYAGSPAVAAHSGAVGRAFSTDTIRFDSATGSFKAEEDAARPPRQNL